MNKSERCFLWAENLSLTVTNRKGKGGCKGIPVCPFWKGNLAHSVSATSFSYQPRPPSAQAVCRRNSFNNKFPEPTTRIFNKKTVKEMTKEISPLSYTYYKPHFLNAACHQFHHYQTPCIRIKCLDERTDHMWKLCILRDSITFVFYQIVPNDVPQYKIKYFCLSSVFLFMSWALIVKQCNPLFICTRCEYLYSE